MFTGGASLTAGLIAGRIMLIIKNILKGNTPNNFHYITFLSKLFPVSRIIIKLKVTIMWRPVIYLLQSKIDACYSRDTKDQLLIDKLVLAEAHKRLK